jgi:hypothetical protein
LLLPYGWFWGNENRLWSRTWLLFPNINDYPYDNTGVGPYPPEADSRIFSYQLGPVVLGVEGKIYAPDSTSKSGDAKTNTTVIFGIGFRF